MPRFFTNAPSYAVGDTVTLTGDDAHHIARSLRMAAGDTVTVCDAEGNACTCRLVRIRDDAADAEVLSVNTGAGEPPVGIRLFMAYPKGDKLETVIQKAVELGAARITPFESERCIKRPPEEKLARITERLSRIAEEAAKQCGRDRLPKVDPPLSFSAMLDAAQKDDLVLFCYEGTGTVSLRALLANTPAPRTCSVIVGSEGGFSEKEANAARERGFRMANLGPRILRCETAPAYVLSALSFAYELPET